MSTSKHTPGPWEVYLTEDRAHPYILQDDPHRPQKVVAIIFDDDADTCPHNATLVAAAPALLATLEVIANQCGDYATDSPALDYASIGNLARAAIAKAKGE